MNDNNDSKTRNFDPVDKKQGGWSSMNSKQKLIVSIFVVIILILLSFTILIFGQIFSARPSSSEGPSDDPSQKMTVVIKDSEDVHTGSLLLVNSSFNYVYPSEQENLINVYTFKNNTANDDYTKISSNGKTFPTYELGGLAASILLDSQALNAFNEMLFDYCETLDLSSLDSGDNASDIQLAWGYSNENELLDDVAKYGADYYDHSLATALTLRVKSTSSAINEDVFKNNYSWLYENCYKYGFIIRYPNACKDKTGLDGSERIHLRYVGYEHAYYMSKNNICLEEYLELIRTQYTYNGEHLTFTADNGSSYEVYYVACSGNPTNVSVPEGSVHTISGDNMNGFIVTIKK